MRAILHDPFERLLTDRVHSFSSFLESRGQPLLDLSLYVCSENYTEWTRPALAQILQWPHQWVVPHKLRDEAKVRSEHLGLSSLDIETASNKDGHTNARDTGYIPKNLVTKPKETVAGMLGKSGHQNQFRLDAVTSDFFEPLWELVKKNGSHSWVFGTDQASSLDCLLLAYMSLMAPPLIPPCNWLQDALSARYPALMQWTTNFRQESFGGPVDPTKLLSMSASNHPASHRDLPWHPQASISMTNIGLTVLKATFDSLPIISRYRSDRIIQASPRDMGTDTTESSAMVQTTKYPRYSGLGVTVGALGASMAYCFYMGFFGPQGSVHQTDVIRRRRNMTDQRDFGEAGKMLGLGVM